MAISSKEVLLNSKDKGNIGESRFLYEFIKRGVPVSLPYGDNIRYDMIAEFNGKLNKIQIKYCNQKISNHNSISCPCSSSANHTTNKHRDYYTKECVDYMGFYLVEWDECILIPMEDIGKACSITIRKTPTKSNMKKNTRMMQDYLLDKVILYV